MYSQDILDEVSFQSFRRGVSDKEFTKVEFYKLYSSTVCTPSYRTCGSLSTRSGLLPWVFRTSTVSSVSSCSCSFYFPDSFFLYFVLSPLRNKLSSIRTIGSVGTTGRLTYHSHLRKGRTGTSPVCNSLSRSGDCHWCILMEPLPPR